MAIVFAAKKICEFGNANTIGKACGRRTIGRMKLYDEERETRVGVEAVDEKGRVDQTARAGKGSAGRWLRIVLHVGDVQLRGVAASKWVNFSRPSAISGKERTSSLDPPSRR